MVSKVSKGGTGWHKTKIILLWIISITFFINFLTTFLANIFSAIFYLLAGFLIFPPITKWLKKEKKISIPTWIKFTIIIILICLAPVLIHNKLTYNQEDSNKLIASQTEQKQICVPSWECGVWSECSKGGLQTRVCTDYAHCGDYKNEPISSQSCKYQSKIGDRVIVDDIAYTINSKTESYQVGKEIGFDIYSQFYGTTADGIFYIFDITVENVGKESQTFWGTNIKIYDNQGRTFDHDPTAELYMDDSFKYDQLQPGLPKRGKIVFDVPRGLIGKLEISSTNMFSDKKEYISWS